MPDAPTKLQRWLDVVSVLASRHFPVSTVDLWREVPSYARGVDGAEQDKRAVRRMFERDKDELKSLGIPIETVTYSINHGDDEQGLSPRQEGLPPPVPEAAAGGRRAHEPGGPPRSEAAPSGGATFELTEAEACAALDGDRDGV